MRAPSRLVAPKPTGNANANEIAWSDYQCVRQEVEQ
jgi:hypothetical protein